MLYHITILITHCVNIENYNTIHHKTAAPWQRAEPVPLILSSWSRYPPHSSQPGFGLVRAEFGCPSPAQPWAGVATVAWDRQLWFGCEAVTIACYPCVAREEGLSHNMLMIHHSIPYHTLALLFNCLEIPPSLRWSLCCLSVLLLPSSLMFRPGNKGVIG